MSTRLGERSACTTQPSTKQTVFLKHHIPNKTCSSVTRPHTVAQHHCSSLADRMEERMPGHKSTKTGPQPDYPECCVAGQFLSAHPEGKLLASPR